ncbi:MAG: Cdc6/Cdc18 family protein [Candidatus Hodarchaeota archaeon]
MIDLIKDELNRKSIFIDDSKLSIEFVPEKLVYREDEFKQITQVFIPLIKSSSFSPKNVLITGNNGSGKTAISKLFGFYFEKISKHFNKNIKYKHINCRLKKSNYNIIKTIIRAFKSNFPEKGFSLYELVSTLKEILDKGNVHLLLTLDEINFLNFKEDNLIYILNRLNDDDFGNEGRISIIGIVKNLSFIKDLDLSTLSSFQYNIVPLSPYSSAQIYGILKFRASLALRRDGFTDEILKFIAELTSKSGDMRYALEILHKAGLYADQNNLDKLTPECIRYAQANVFENLDFYSLDSISKHEKLVLLSICRSLRKNNSISVKLEDFKQSYLCINEELNDIPLKKSQLYNILNRLKNLEYISIKSPQSKKRGNQSTISINNVPVQVLEKKITDLL